MGAISVSSDPAFSVAEVGVGIEGELMDAQTAASNGRKGQDKDHADESHGAAQRRRAALVERFKS